MGGVVDRSGNITSWAEFNLWNDPEAAAVVLSSGAAVTLVGRDVCEQVRIGPDDMAECDGALQSVLRGWFSIRPPGESMNACDPLPVAVTIDPDLVGTEEVALRVDTTNGDKQDRTLRGRSDPSVQVALGVRVAGYCVIIC